ncbi:hypothetical protein SAMN05192583_0438 [Sphingomonas gellani]|uniref:Uncharacterized protein n=1 Tax=Sphingomonas gellani TaxID=1166340 RepID=A0A1H7YWX7_9SPHN|nr:hypothetical protein [Sphingomonas gellani]SEM50473.1 hypothetical protein SAMN05192583_0438 [Sphingomonas gellani]
MAAAGALAATSPLSAAAQPRLLVGLCGAHGGTVEIPMRHKGNDGRDCSGGCHAVCGRKDKQRHGRSVPD